MICILLSVRYSVTAFVATIGMRCGKYTSRGPLWKCSRQIFSVFLF